MRRVRRDEIVDWATYEDERAGFRSRVLAAKAPRRVHLGEHLTLLFENTMTIRYQIQEMVRAERIVREADIQHEIDTYNEILGGPGELGCTLLIEIDDAAIRDVKLREWWSLPERLYLVAENGVLTPATFDPRQRGEGRLSSVQYLKFDVGGRTPTGAVVDLPTLAVETRFGPETRAALAEDLSS
jgi:hypothetical protein